MVEEIIQNTVNPKALSRKERIEFARSRDILDVAQDLNMELFKDGENFRWKEHNSLVITPSNNLWNWFSRTGEGGDVIALVESIKEINFNQAIDYLNDGSFQTFTSQVKAKEPFSYYLKPYESEFVEARDYLKSQRALSDATINFFESQGVLAQANAKLNNAIEPVVVFKTLSSEGEVVGASLQGIIENREKWSQRGYAKSIIRNSEEFNGMHVDVGIPNRLIFAESPIDLMSYYELHHDQLENVRLVSLNGLKESTIGRHLGELEAQMAGRPIRWTLEELKDSLDSAIEKNYFKNPEKQSMITLAIDNDEGGRNFMTKLNQKGVTFIEDIPDLSAGQEKTDWNDVLKTFKKTGIKKEPEIQAQKKERTNSSTGSLQDKPEGSSTPVSEITETFERSVTSRPTLSSHLLQFTINEEFKSSNDGRYHYINQKELNKLSRRSGVIQEAANYYLEELANTKVSYFTADGNIVQVDFEEKHFMHMTGIKPLGANQTPEKTLHDLASGNLAFDNIKLANNENAFKKIGVLPDLGVALSTGSFYFNELQKIDRYRDRFDSLIMAEDKDIMLLFKVTEDDERVPASVFKTKAILTEELKEANKNDIVGIYRERNGEFEQIAINEDYISDGGQEMFSILKNRSYEGGSEHQNDYSVQLTGAEMLPEGSHLPFSVGDSLSYQTFVQELYGLNQGLFKEVIETSPKIHFTIHNSDGEIVKSDVIYKIGQEEKPVSQLLGLGYTRLKGQADLAQIDERVLAELDEKAINQSISVEANEQSKLPKDDIAQDQASNEKMPFISKQEEMRAGIKKEASQFKEPMTEEPFDYTSASGYDLSKQALKQIRDYVASPEDFKEYLDFMSQFPNLSPRNVALVQAQWQGANAVATFNQWKALGDDLGITSEDVIISKNSYTNKKTGQSKEVINDKLSVSAGEKAKITLFRPQMVKMIPVINEDGKQAINAKGNPKFKKLSEASPQEKEALKNGHLKVTQFQERDSETGLGKFTTYKVFELSQTTLKPEAYPKAMPNRHYQFNSDTTKAKEVMAGLEAYSSLIGVPMSIDKDDHLGNAKGAFSPSDQRILLNPKNGQGEAIATAIHELAHASLHNPRLIKGSQNLPTATKELEAEMSSYLVSKHFGLDTSEEAISYMAKWTKNLKSLDDKGLQESMKRVHKTVSSIVSTVNKDMKMPKVSQKEGQRQAVNFSQTPKRGMTL